MNRDIHNLITAVLRCRAMMAVCMLVALLISQQAAAQPGSIDHTFNPGDIGFGVGTGANGNVKTCAIQSDGKIIIGGNFLHYNETARNRIARLNVDGTLDAAFNVGTGANGQIRRILIQADGKVLLIGGFSSFNGTTRSGLTRLLSDGSTDPGFNIGSGAPGGVYDAALQPDGKILIVGNFTLFNGTARNRIARLNSDGTLDLTFNPGSGADTYITTIALQADGKILIGGGFSVYGGSDRNHIARLNGDGSLDVSFDPGTGTDGWIESMAVQPDGKVLIAGGFSEYDGTGLGCIARINTDGSLDPSFNTGSGADGTVLSIIVQSSGKIFIGGDFSDYNGSARNRVVGVNSDGSLDLSFNPGAGANNVVWSVTQQSDGKFLFAGDYTQYNGSDEGGIARVHPDGSLDHLFNAVTGANRWVFATLVQPDGKTLIGGDFTEYNGSQRNRIARLNTDGSLDQTFNPGSGLDYRVWTIARQPDGKILIGGNFTRCNGVARNRLARLHPDGTLDMTFNSGLGFNNDVYNIALQPDGKILVGGSFSSYNNTTKNNLIRLNPDGSLDPTFTTGFGPSYSVFSIIVSPDAKIIIAGAFTSYNLIGRNRIARLNADGSLDPSFNPGTGTNVVIYSTALQADGRIILGGAFTSFNGTARNRIARVNPDGTLDPTFNPGVGANSSVNTTALQADGKIIIGGEFTSYNATSQNCIARLNTDGSVDASFVSGSGASGNVQDLSIQPDGKILIGGYFTSYNGIGRNRIARIFGSQVTCTPPSITSSPVSVNSCPGEPVTFSVVATGTSLSYQWRKNGNDIPGALGDSYSIASVNSGYAGNYDVVVAGACGPSQTSAVATLTVGETATITASGPTSFCEGASVVLEASDGLAWLWSNNETTRSITVTTGGDYFVTVNSANNCSTTSELVTVTVHPLPTVSITAQGPTTFCEGASVTLTASGADSYLWNTAETTPSIIVSSSGSYSVIGTDANGCFATATPVEVHVQPLVSAGVVTGSPALCVGSSAVFSSNGTPGGTWSSADNSVATVHPTSGLVTAMGAGSTAISYVISSGCGSPAVATATVLVDPCTTFCINGQGYYSSANNTGLINTLLPITVGKPGRSLTFEMNQGSCIVSKLPAGGPPSSLPAGLGDYSVGTSLCPSNTIIPLSSTGRFNNVLLGQMIALTLNSRRNAFLTSFILPASFCTQLDPQSPVEGPYTIPASVFTALGNLSLPNTVGGLLELANRALAGYGTGGASPSEINSAVNAINVGFDECRTLVSCQNPKSVVNNVGTSFGLHGNFPNPFNPSTTISYSIPADAAVQLRVYDALGREVAVLVNEMKSAGTHNVQFDAGNLNSGLYLYRLTAHGSVLNGKMSLMK